MKLNRPFLAIALVGALMLVGCGKPQADTGPGSTEPATPVATDAQQPAPLAMPDHPTAATNEALSGAAEFQQRSLASPFAQAEQVLKEDFNRALIAFQIEDYARAVTELDDLAAMPELTPEQQQAVKELLAKALKMAPELAASRAATTPPPGTDNPSEFPVAVPGAAEAPKNVPESPFSTADPAVKRSYARAQAAFDLGNYDSARAELQDLVTNTQLNFQQKYAVQSLLDKTPQAAPAAKP
jgi:hypothetical protein